MFLKVILATIAGVTVFGAAGCEWKPYPGRVAANDSQPSCARMSTVGPLGMRRVG